MILLNKLAGDIRPGNVVFFEQNGVGVLVTIETTQRLIEEGRYNVIAFRALGGEAFRLPADEPVFVK